MGAKCDGLHIAQDVPWAVIAEGEHIQQPIIGSRVFEEHEGSAVVPAVAKEHDPGGPDFPVGRDELDVGCPPACGLCKAEQVAQRPESLLGFRTREPHDLRVNAGSSKLHKVARAGAWEVQLSHMPLLDDLPRVGEGVGGYAEFRGEHIHGSHRENAECGLGSGKAIDHRIDGAVSACGNDHVAARLRCIASNVAGLRRG